MNKGKISMSIQWSTEKLKQWRGEIEREKSIQCLIAKLSLVINVRQEEKVLSAFSTSVRMS